MARFDNATGETTFDGGIEYAVAQELGKSDAIDVVAGQRVIGVLQLMKKPVDTVVDRAVGRDVCLRDGRITALVSGRLEKDASGYRATVELLDPAHSRVIASSTEMSPDISLVLPAFVRAARRLGGLFSERRAQIEGPVVIDEQVATSSQAALLLYNEAARAHKEWQVEKARDLLKRAVAEDPEFGSAWLGLASVLQQTGGSDADVQQSIRRALESADDAPEWERRYIRGASLCLNRDYEAAVPELEAVARLRPDFPRAARFLIDAYERLDRLDGVVAVRKAMADHRPADIAANYEAASTIVQLHQNTEEARPYVERLDELLTPDSSHLPSFYVAARWRRMLPAYEAWRSGNLARAQELVDREAAGIEQWPERERGVMHAAIGAFYMSLGRMRDAQRKMQDSGDPWNLMILAELQGDLPELRRQLLTFAPSRIGPQIAFRMAKAGLVEQVRPLLSTAGTVPEDVITEMGRAALDLADGRHERGMQRLRKVLAPSNAYLSGEYQNACDLLAHALIRVPRNDEAISVLEQCAAAAPRFFGTLNTGYWMKNRLYLADQYRAAGRLAQAVPIEQQLRQLLVYADADHPMILQLNAR